MWFTALIKGGACAALPILRRVPVWAWVLVFALGWGAYQRHRATTATEALATAQARSVAAQAAAREASARERARRLAAQLEVARDAQVQSDRAAADAAARTAAAERLLQRARSVAARAAPTSASAAAASPTTDAPADVLVDVLGRCVTELGVVAAFADRAHIAGQACERSYDSLTP